MGKTKIFVDAVDISSEYNRIYTFPGNEKVIIHEPATLVVRPSGDHRIETKGGLLHIIAPGWIHIEIKSRTGWVA